MNLVRVEKDEERENGYKIRAGDCFHLSSLRLFSALNRSREKKRLVFTGIYIFRSLSVKDKFQLSHIKKKSCLRKLFLGACVNRRDPKL